MDCYTANNPDQHSAVRSPLAIGTSQLLQVIDLHFQTRTGFGQVLDEVLDNKLAGSKDGTVWVITGSGHHVVQNSHQKKGELSLVGLYESGCRRGVATIGKGMA